MHSPLYQGPPPLVYSSPLRYRELYPLNSDSIPKARHHFQEAAERSDLIDEITYSVVTCLSELATNAVLHAQDPRPRGQAFFLVISKLIGGSRRTLEVGVHDIDSEHVPRLPPSSVDSEDEGGRGLFLVDALSNGIRIEHGSGLRGKTIWARWDLPAVPRQHDDPWRPTTSAVG